MGSRGKGEGRRREVREKLGERNSKRSKSYRITVEGRKVKQREGHRKTKAGLGAKKGPKIEKASKKRLKKKGTLFYLAAEPILLLLRR